MSRREVLRDSDGNVVAAFCTDAEISDEERAGLTEFFTWVRDHADELITPEMAARQDASRERLRQRTARLRGEQS